MFKGDRIIVPQSASGRPASDTCSPFGSGKVQSTSQKWSLLAWHQWCNTRDGLSMLHLSKTSAKQPERANDTAASSRETLSYSCS